MNDRDTYYDDDPLKNPSTVSEIITWITVAVIFVGLIVLIVLAGPPAWCQTYGSPCS